MQTKKFLILITSIILLSCNGQSEKKQNLNIREDMETSSNTVETVLRNQLKSGYSQSNDITDVKYVDFTKESIKSSNFLINQILKEEKYSVSSKDFDNKIKSIFGNLKFDDNISLIDKTKKCQNQQSIELNDPNGFRNIIVIDKLNKIITDQYAIPEIINYKLKYSKIANEESEMSPDYKNNRGETITINKWKDKQNLIILVRKNQELMINRNFYLFKNDQSKLYWLLENDKDFLMNLILDYGWLDDDKLLSFTIQEVSSDNDYEKFSKLFWNKNCEGTFRINSKTYKNIEKEIKAKKISSDDFLDRVSLFFDYLNNEDTTIFNNLSTTEKTKALCNLAYFAEQFKFKDEKSNHRIMGKFRYYLNEDEINMMIQNNYYDLPEFKNWWVKAKEDEIYVKECLYGGTCGQGNPEL